MRNLKEYPVTTDEIVTFLDILIKKMSYENTGCVGDMRPLLLQKAKEIVVWHGKLPPPVTMD